MPYHRINEHGIGFDGRRPARSDRSYLGIDDAVAANITATGSGSSSSPQSSSSPESFGSPPLASSSPESIVTSNLRMSIDSHDFQDSHVLCDSPRPAVPDEDHEYYSRSSRSFDPCLNRFDGGDMPNYYGAQSDRSSTYVSSDSLTKIMSQMSLSIALPSSDDCFDERRDDPADERCDDPIDGNSDEHSDDRSDDVVPPLDLDSESESPTARGNYIQMCKATRVANHKMSEEAYENWLSGKRKLLAEKVKSKKKDEEQRVQEAEERKRKSEEKVAAWREAKAVQKARMRELEAKKQMMKEPAIKQPPKQLAKQKSSVKPTTAEEARDKLVQWERNKQLQEERRRKIRREQEQRRLVEEKERRQQSAEAWEEWVSKAASKPKPVPLNKGIFTLRGTISNIYINPNKWKTLDEKSDDEDDKKKNKKKNTKK